MNLNVRNRACDRAVAKYELTHAVRSHIGSDDDAFNAIRQREDEVRALRARLSQSSPWNPVGHAILISVLHSSP